MSEKLGITWEELKSSQPTINSAPNTSPMTHTEADALYSAANQSLNNDVESSAYYTAMLAKQIARKQSEGGAGFDGHNVERREGDKRMGYRSTMGAIGVANGLTDGLMMAMDSVYADPLEIEAALYSLGIMSGTKYKFGHTLGSKDGPWYITIKPLGKMCIGANAGVAEEFITVDDPFTKAMLEGTPYADNYLKPLPIVDIYPNTRRLPLLPGLSTKHDQVGGHPYSWSVGGSVALTNNRINYGVYAPVNQLSFKMVKGKSESLDIFAGLKYKFPFTTNYDMSMSLTFVDDMYKSLETYLIDYLRRTVSMNSLGVVPWQNLLWEIDLVMLRPGPAIERCFRFITLIDSDGLHYEVQRTGANNSNGPATINVNFSIVGMLPTAWDNLAAYGDNPSLLMTTMTNPKNGQAFKLGDFKVGDPDVDAKPNVE